MRRLDRRTAWMRVAFVALVALLFTSGVVAADGGSSATAQPEDAGRWVTADKVGAWVSRLHPAVVHFPIALILSACVAEAAGVFRRESSPTPAARFCLLLGTGGALAAMATGWLKFLCGPDTGPVDPSTHLHRTVGTVAGCWAILLFVAAQLAVRYPNATLRWTYRGMLVVGAALVGFTGHLGGALIFGQDYLSFQGT